MLVGGSEVPWGPCPFGSLRMYSALPLQNLNSKAGKLEQNILRVVRGITNRRGSFWRDRYVEWHVGSTQEKEPSWVVCPTSTKVFSNASASKDGAWGGLPCIPDIVIGRIPPEGSLATTLVLRFGGDNGWWPRVGICSTVFLVGHSPAT